MASRKPCVCVNYRILEEYLESDSEAQKVLETRYGEKVLKRLLTAYKAERGNGSAQNEREISEKERRYREERKNEVAARKYIRENTVHIPLLFYSPFPHGGGKEPRLEFPSDLLIVWILISDVMSVV